MTPEEAKETIENAKDLGFSGAEFLETLGAENVRRSCNGIGPEKMPKKWRVRLDNWLWLFKDPCRCHDCRFTFDNDGSEAKFRAANDELGRNCLIMADSEYTWYNPLRYVWRHRAKGVAWVCQTFGWESWREAYVKAKKQGIVSCSNGFPAGAGNAGDGKPSA